MCQQVGQDEGCKFMQCGTMLRPSVNVFALFLMGT